MAELWPQVTTENLDAVSDIAGYREEFLRLFGFGLPGDRLRSGIQSGGRSGFLESCHCAAEYVEAVLLRSFAAEMPQARRRKLSWT